MNYDIKVTVPLPPFLQRNAQLKKPSAPHPVPHSAKLATKRTYSKIAEVTILP
jgi:hypothetical protein